MLYSSRGPNPLWVNYTSTYVYNATLGSRPDLAADFAYPFAPKVVVQKTVSPASGTVDTSHTVTLTVQNLDSVTVDNLNVTDSEASFAYRSTMELSPSGDQKIQLATFIPGDSKSLIYSATPKSSGKYVLSAANAEFSWTARNGTRIRYSVSTDEVVLASLSGPATQFSNSFNDLYPYSILLLVPLLLAPVSETLRLVARRSKKKPARSMQPPPTPPPTKVGQAQGSKLSSETETKESPPEKT